MRQDLIATDRIARAAVCACQLHGSQTRDDGRTPYAVHPFRVADYLRTLANESDADVLCAAYLHDTIEDTGSTFDTIAAQFGPDVATLVAELTNDSRLPKAQRKAAMIEHIPMLSARAKRIKLADRLDNVSDLLRDCGATPEKCERYVPETARILQGCEGACPELERALGEALGELRKKVAGFRG